MSNLGAGSTDMIPPFFILTGDFEHDRREVLPAATEPAVSMEQSFKNFLLVNFFIMIFPLKIFFQSHVHIKALPFNHKIFSVVKVSDSSAFPLDFRSQKFAFKGELN